MAEKSKDTIEDPQKLPATAGPPDLTNLQWGHPVLLDTETDCNDPCALALDRDRAVLYWTRNRTETRTRFMAAVQLSTEKIGDIVPTEFDDTFWPPFQEQRLAPLDADTFVAAERDGETKAMARAVSVSEGLKLTLRDPDEVCAPCGLGTDLYRLFNGNYVLGTIGMTDKGTRPGFCVFSVDKATFKVTQRSQKCLGKDSPYSSPYMSLLVSRSKNRVAIGDVHGLTAFEVNSDLSIIDKGRTNVTCLSEFWYRGFGLDIGEGCAVQMFCSARLTDMLVVDLNQDDPDKLVLAVVKRHTERLDYHRPCVVGGHIVVCGRYRMDVINIKGKETKPRDWSHVREYWHPDMCSCGTPCVVGDQLALFYQSIEGRQLRMLIGK